MISIGQYILVFLVGFIIGKIIDKCYLKINLRYPLTAITNGLLYLWIFLSTDLGINTISYYLLTSILLVISVIDEQTKEIPLICNILIGMLGLVHLLSDLTHYKGYILGMFLVSGLLYILYIFTKRKGIGGGDIKLMAAAGFLFGGAKIVLAFILASILGSLIHTLRMKFGRATRQLAFGPYLCIGIFLTMLYGDRIITWYLHLCGF